MNVTTKDDFKFMSSIEFESELKLNAEKQIIIGCPCDTTCIPETCYCLQLHGKNYDQENRLLDVSINRHTSSNINQSECRPVFECNGICACADNCGNRVVQSGMEHPIDLQLINTQVKGIGLVSKQDLKQGQFVLCYIGEILSRSEALKRTQLYSKNDRNYVCSVVERVGDSINTWTCIDATNVGNESRYMNHSCEPNVTVVPVRIDYTTPYIALFCLEDIQKGKELTFDYSGGNEAILHGRDGMHTLDRVPCLCGSSKCTGFLPFDPLIFNQIM